MIIKEGKTNWRYILIVATLAIFVGAGILWWTNQQDFSIEFPEIKKPGKNKCNVGKEIVSGSERSNYDCEGINNCEWRPLGCELGPSVEEKKCYFACCPKDLTFSDESRSIYGRCFKLID